MPATRAEAGQASAPGATAALAGDAARGRRVVMLVYNNCTTDARVLKEAGTLHEAGHEVTIVAVLDKTTEPVQERDGLHIERIDRRPLHYRFLWWWRRSVRRGTRLAVRRARRRVRRAARLGRARALRAGRRVRRRTWRRLRIWRLRARRVVRRAMRIGAGIRDRLAERAWSARGLDVERLLAERAAERREWARARFLRDVARRRVRLARAAEQARERLERSERRAARRQDRRARRAALWALARGGTTGGGEGEAPAALPAAAPRSRWVALAAAPLVLLLRAGIWVARLPMRLLRVLGRIGLRTLMFFHKPLMFGDWYWRAYRLLREREMDVLHAHDLNTLPAGAALAWRTRTPLVYDAHELYPEISTLSRIESTVWRVVEWALARRPDAAITVCPSIADELQARHRRLPEPLVLLNCPRRAGAPVQDTGLLRAAAGLTEADGPIVLYHGGFAPNRGLEALVRAAGLLRRGTVVLMGWGRLEEALRDQIRAAGLGDRVRIVPAVAQHELLGYAAGAALGVIPYEPVGLNNTYTTPNKLFEYMAAGVAVAGSDLPELRRIVLGHDLGRTFPPGDAEAMAGVIDEMLADPDRLAVMRANARAAALEYTWDNEAVKLRALYDSPALAAAPAGVAA